MKIKNSIYSCFRSITVPLLVIVAISFAGHTPAIALSYYEPIVLIDSSEDAATINIQNAEKLVVSKPTAENYLALSLVYFNAGRFKDCIAASRTALTHKKNYAEAYNNIAVGYQMLAQWDSAIAASKKAVMLAPDFQLAKNNLSWEVSQKHVLDSTVQFAQKLADTSPTPENYIALTLADYQAGRNTECIAAANKALVLRPEYAIAWNNMCAAYIALGEWDFAIVAGSEALRIDPTSELSKNNLNYAKGQITAER